MTDDAVRCPKCNSEAFAGAHFCMSCGTRLEGSSPQIEIDLDLEDLRASEPTSRRREHAVLPTPPKAQRARVSAPQPPVPRAPDFSIDDIDNGFEAIQSLAPNMSSVPADVGSLDAMHALFSELISTHLLPIRDLMADIEKGERQSAWLEVSRPAARAVKAAAQQLSNVELQRALSELSQTLDQAAPNGTLKLSKLTCEKLQKSYAAVAELLPELQRIERGREQSEPSVRTIYERCEGLDESARNKLYAAGFTRLLMLAEARPDEIAIASGIGIELADRVCVETKRFISGSAADDDTNPSNNQEETGKRMADFSRDEVLRRVRLKQSLKRAGLNGIDLSSANLEGVDFSRADLDGANLEGAKLRGAIFKNASMRDANLKGADLEQCNLEKADLEGANLTEARLAGANLDRAALERAKLDQATLVQASLVGAELSHATLSRASLQEADLTDCELAEADLSLANLSGADLTSASLGSANLQGVVLDGATLDDVDLTSANLSQASLSEASLERCNLDNANLTSAKLRAINARNAIFDNANLENVEFSEAKLGTARFRNVKFTSLRAEWIDGSIAGDGSKRIPGHEVASFLLGEKPKEQPSTRYFGKGDVLRDATLEFGDGSKIHIDSRFENCTISLGKGAELTIGDPGVLRDCQITGSGDITIHGCFFERQSPGIAGVRSLVVSSHGAMVGAVEQAPESTVFAFQPGCRLRVKILRPHERLAAE